MAKQDFCFERWHSISIAARIAHQIPSIPGIYAFIEQRIYGGNPKVVYIGKSIDLSVRLKPYHKVERTFINSRRSLNRCLYVKFFPTNYIDEKEIEYIKRLKPFYNICHNPNIKRKIVYLNGKTLY